MRATLEQLHDIFATDQRDPDAFADYRCLRICGDLFSLCRMRIYRSNKIRESERAKRGAITEFSDVSRKRMARDLRARVYGWRISRFLTFSYPAEYPFDGKEFKAHWKGMLDRIQSRWPGIRIFWFLEFQKRGAPHFHAFVDRPLHHWKIKQLWQESTSGAGGFVYITDWRRKGKNKKEPWRYALKYSDKQEQKEVPSFISRVGRFWGWRNPPEKIDAHCAIDAMDIPSSADYMVEKFLEQLITGKEFYLSLSIPYLEFYSASSQSKSIALKLQSSIVVFNAYCRHLRNKRLDSQEFRQDYEMLALKDF